MRLGALPFSTTLNPLVSAKETMKSAQRTLEAKVGAFLTTGAEIETIRKRASSYKGHVSPEVDGLAKGVIARSSSLLTNYESVKASAVEAAKQGAALVGKSETDPQWKALAATNWSSLGWRTVQAAQGFAGEALAAAKLSYSIVRRIDDHQKQMKGLRADLARLSRLSQGKGLVSFTTDLKKGFGSWQRTVTLMGGALVLGYLALPQLMKGTARRVARR